MDNNLPFELTSIIAIIDRQASRENTEELISTYIIIRSFTYISGQACIKDS